MFRRLTWVFLATAVWLSTSWHILHSQAPLPSPAPAYERYIIFLDDEPLVRYNGRLNQLAATAPRATGQPLALNSPAVQAYAHYLASQRAQALATAAAVLGRPVVPLIQFGVAANGFGAELTAEEAAVLATQPHIALVAPEPIYDLHTDAGPTHIGAADLWAAPTIGTQGRGMVVGIFDTGVDPTNPSFAAVGGDGFTHANPRSHYYGVCDPNQTITQTATLAGVIGGILPYDETFPCNDKLIGAWGYAWSDISPRDTNGHGSHTASTVAGNVLPSVLITSTTSSFTAAISGVAPHANIIAYDVCQDTGACFGYAILLAQNQAILDGVQVVNFSAGGRAATAPWQDPIALTWLAMREAGIFVATSAGNNGDGAATVGSPADLPWVTAVAAASHGRQFTKQITLTNTLGQSMVLEGQSVTGAWFTPTEVVLAADYANVILGTADQARLCRTGIFPAGTFAGQLVVCDVGVYSRVGKGQTVRDAGGAGLILTQPEAHNGGPGSLLVGPHVLPTIALDYENSQMLHGFISQTVGLGAGPVRGQITAGVITRSAALADMVTPFSSRGPNAGVGLGNVLVPKLAAPGRNIIAATAQEGGPPSFGVLSGTSMSSPHVAGAAVLLRAIHPAWTPAQVEAALMTTAVPMWDDDGVTPATPFDQGAGRIDVLAATQAGLVLDVPSGAFMAADPALGGNPGQLNLAGLVDGQCIGRCTWVRTVQSSAPFPVAWEASMVGVAGQVSPASFLLPPGASQTLIITAEVAFPAGWHFGSVRLQPAAAAVPPAHLTIAAFSQISTLPDVLNVVARTLTGSVPLTAVQAITITDWTVDVSGLVRGTSYNTLLGQDSTRSNPYDRLGDVWVVTTTIPISTAEWVVEIISTESRDLDLFVGVGGVPTATAELTRSATAEPLEQIMVADPAPGVYWIVVQNWLSGGARTVDDVRLVSAAVPAVAAGNLSFSAPAAVPLRQPFDVHMQWQEPTMVAGEWWYGSALFWASPTRTDLLGRTAVRLHYELIYPVYLPVVGR